MDATNPSVPNETSPKVKEQPVDPVSENETHESEHTVQAWSTVAGSFLVYFVAFGYMNSFGYFQNYYQENDLSGYSSPIIALIGSLQIGLMYVIGPISGALFDAYGHKWLYVAGAVGAIISCLGLSFAQKGHIWQYMLSQGLLFGLTVSFGTTVALAVVGQHFKRHRTLAMGIIASGSSAGGVCFPIIFSQLVPKLGFRWAIRIVPLFFICFYGLGMLLSRAKVARRPLKSAKEIVDFRGFRDRRYTTLAIATIIGNLGLYVPYNYIEPFFRLHHPNDDIGTYLLSIINGASFFGRAMGGFVADRVGVLNLLYPITILCGILSLTMWLKATSVGLIVAFTCLYGFCSGVYISIMPSVIVRISPMENVGARLGAFFSLSAIGVFVGTPIGGAFLRNGTEAEFRGLVLFSGATMAAAGALLLLGRYFCDSNMRTKW